MLTYMGIYLFISAVLCTIRTLTGRIERVMDRQRPRGDQTLNRERTVTLPHTHKNGHSFVESYDTYLLLSKLSGRRVCWTGPSRPASTTTTTKPPAVVTAEPS